ncbi:hypothetical protein [Streptomyces sp. NPDC047028]|uniref:COG1470 family protein n=1 Tax=Streptomyces sp. NPDC047028 TaxID=3155793 RepID=UPI0033DCEBBD
MGVELTLTPQHLDVEPGQTVECELTLHNTGSIVDQFSVELIGDANDWASIEPRFVNLFPDSDTTITAKFSPPRSSAVKAGEIPFAVRATSREDPAGSQIEEGTVRVKEFVELAAEFLPHGSHASFRTRHRLAVDNLSNHDLPVGIRVAAADDELVFKLAKPSVDIQAGRTVLVPVSVIPKKRFFKGRNKTHPFQATLTTSGNAPVTADAAMIQEQILPKWFFKAFMTLLALVATLGILSATVFKESLESDETPAPPTAPQPSSSTPAPSATTPAPATGVPPNGSSTAPGQSTATGSASSSGAGTEVIQANAAPGQSGTFQQFNYTVPNGQTYTLTDITLSSPPGSTGTVQVQHGSDTLVSQPLDNLSTYTQHLDQPVVVGSGDQIILAVDCHNSSSPCTPAAVLTGQLQ